MAMPWPFKLCTRFSSCKYGPRNCSTKDLFDNTSIGLVFAGATTSWMMCRYQKEIGFGGSEFLRKGPTLVVCRHSQSSLGRRDLPTFCLTLPSHPDCSSSHLIHNYLPCEKSHPVQKTTTCRVFLAKFDDIAEFNINSEMQIPLLSLFLLCLSGLAMSNN